MLRAEERDAQNERREQEDRAEQQDCRNGRAIQSNGILLRIRVHIHTFSLHPPLIQGQHGSSAVEASGISDAVRHHLQLTQHEPCITLVAGVRDETVHLFPFLAVFLVRRE